MTRLFVQCFDDERSENSGEFEGSEPYQTSKLINQSMIRKFKTFTFKFQQQPSDQLWHLRSDPRLGCILVIYDNTGW